VWWSLLAIAAVLVGLWVVFVVFVFVVRPDSSTVRETVRLFPDALRLVKRLATDRTIPLRARVPVWLLVVYLASPIDLIPDFVPVIGFADDAVVTALVLRRFIRRAGTDKLTEHWPGSPEGLARLQQLLRISPSG
jgi:uncharacterized membrane protein YkvA (DUF1232 family)